MKYFNVLAVSVGFALVPLAHAADTTQPVAIQATAPAGNSSMVRIEGVKVDMGDGNKDHAKMGGMGMMPGMGMMGNGDHCDMRQGRRDAMMDNCMAMGMAVLARKNEALEAKVQALDKRVDFLQSVVQSLLEK